MLRPRFSLSTTSGSGGLICSEKQAIDATLRSLSDEDPRVGTWGSLLNARAAATRTGLFRFLTWKGKAPLPGKAPDVPRQIRQRGESPFKSGPLSSRPGLLCSGGESRQKFNIASFFELQRPELLFDYLQQGIRTWDYSDFMECLKEIKTWARKGMRILRSLSWL